MKINLLYAIINYILFFIIGFMYGRKASLILFMFALCILPGWFIIVRLLEERFK